MRHLAPILSILTLASLTASPASAQWSVDNLSIARQGAAATSVDGKALIAGGRVGNTMQDRVDIHDEASGTWTTATLSVPRTLLAAVSSGHLAFFAGGSVSLAASSNVVDVYDAQTGTWSTATLSVARFSLSAAAVGTKVIFAGGATGGPFAAVVSNVVDVYDSSMGAPSNPAAWSSGPPLSVARGAMGSATVGSRAIFAGGIGASTAEAAVDIYDDSTGTWSTSALSQARALYVAGVAAGNRAYFAGGQIVPGVFSDVVDVYDGLTGTWSTAVLSAPRALLGATAVGNTVLFAGGSTTGIAFDTVDVFNAGTGAVGPTMHLSEARGDLCAIRVGNKALFAGGLALSGVSTTVDIYAPIGVSYCAALPNSTGAAATIGVTGSASIAANDLVLRAVSMPDAPFLFFHGSSQMQAVFGNGFRCVGGNVVRIGPTGVASGGVAESIVDLPTVGITNAGVRNFQCWYRNPAAGGAGFNLSDGIEITFVP